MHIPSGVMMMLKSMGFDPDLVMRNVESIRDSIGSVDARLLRAEQDNARILRNQARIMEHLGIAPGGSEDDNGSGHEPFGGSEQRRIGGGDHH